MPTKVEYLEILLENPDGVTVKDCQELYFFDEEDYVSPKSISLALKRLQRQGKATREKEENGKSYRYWITDQGIQKYNYYMSLREEI